MTAKSDCDVFHVFGSDGSFEASYHDEVYASSHAGAIGGHYEPGVVLATLPTWVSNHYVLDSERARQETFDDYDSVED